MDDVVLIDADSIYFQASYRLKKNEVRKKIDEVMADIEAKSFMAQPFVAVKGQGNFRKDLYRFYKANRKRDYEPEHAAALNYGHQYMVDKYNAVMADGMEADDLVCIWAYEAREQERNFLIAGIDKDLKQIPGHHYNFNKQEFDFVSDDSANLNLMLQCLTGDSGDNIPGIRGIGPAKAAKILVGRDSPESRWRRVRAAWAHHNAGDPSLSRRLLEMIKTWDEYEDIKARIANETAVRKQDVPKEQVEDSGVSGLSERDEGHSVS